MNIRSLAVGLVLGLTAGAYSLSGANTFPDVSPSDWFAQYVNQIKDWGIISGNDDGTFAPGRNVNRAELAKMFVLQDERIDEKITSALADVETETEALEPAPVTPTVMYLNMRNSPAALCPDMWDEVDYGYHGEGNERINERVCTTDHTCEVMYLTKHQNNVVADCPTSWNEASYGRVENEDWQRVCWICAS